ncbi:uncharacterized protein PpBr36_10644 [Pyricularia pennisetigena]|uniref:uncharacterized protein n=1 Tax=Pyricularia pennisetigena TaxID=1578925 RepID=UPI00114F6AC9|nr:uncharacterized protein PpBr36_10644 [Pyricularia pennisetigena]TLS21074.1 hypothetical protein PpBr36_10644 [Pyricularia pennisetigena]
MPHTTDVDLEAASLCRHLLDSYSPDHGAGFITPSVYDTAWLGLVKKGNANGQQQWLFPECFQYLLDTQLADGGWQAYSRVDGILNTAVSLLALRRHASEPLQIASPPAADVNGRVERATAALQAMLNAWEVAETVEETTHFAYETIVPTLLRLLEDEGIPFEFQGKAALLEMRGAKMAAFNPENLYGKTKIPAIHHLEAFLGQIDYSKVAHHKVGGGFMGSPSSTAAYLVGLPNAAWDDEAEGYLFKVLAKAGGKCVPSASPSIDFESLWILSALLQAGFSETQLGSAAIDVAEVLDRAFEAGSAAVGFVPSIMVDADETAKLLILLNTLGIPKSAAKLLKDYKTASFGTSCNVLLALLHQPNPAEHVDQIVKVVDFIGNAWWKNNWPMQDEKNHSPFYPCLLVVQALVKLVELLEGGKLSESLVSDTEIRTKITLAIFHATIRTVEAQESEGSWNQSVEETAYAVILISTAAHVALFDPIRQRLVDAVRNGEKWLQRNQAKTSQAGEYLWIGKVSYGSPVLTRAYRLAALKSASFLAEKSTIGHCLRTADSWPESKGYIKVYSRTPLFCKVPEPELYTAVLESSLFLPMLKERRYNIFSREGVSKDKYFTLVPFTWTGSCMLNGLQPSAEWYWEMTKVGVLGFQTDEFFEGVLRPDELDLFRRYVRFLVPIEFDDSHFEPDKVPGIERLKPMADYTDYIMNHWAVQRATPADRLDMARELRAYLFSQIHQTGLNIQSARLGAAFKHPQSYFMWARITGTEHIASPIYFSFLACMIPQSVLPSLAGSDILPTMEEKYYSEAVSKHSGAMCRMYNDMGSIPRDTAEKNLNSVHFPEFNQTIAETKKQALWDIAQFEREAFEDALARLERATRKRMVSMGEKEKQVTEVRIKYWRMYCDITDLYGQIWVLRDFSAPVFQPAR